MINRLAVLIGRTSFSERDPAQIDAKIRQKLTGITYEKGFLLLKYIQDIRILYKLGWKLPEGMKEADLDDLERIAKGEE